MLNQNIAVSIFGLFCFIILFSLRILNTFWTPKASYQNDIDIKPAVALNF